MYLRGRLTINLAGTEIVLQPPRNFFGGVANLLTRGSWQTQEELETYKLLAFAQSTHRALIDMGVRDVVRVAVGPEVIYEDLHGVPDDYAAAMAALQARLCDGFEPDPRGEFDLVLKHDDGVLTYVIDLDFFRGHRPGTDPLSVQVTAVPSELRKGEAESLSTYRQRIAPGFETESEFDARQERWQAQLDAFLERLADHFRRQFGIEELKTESRRFLPRSRGEDALERGVGWGFPLYGFLPGTDLAHLLLWDSLWSASAFRPRDFHYGDYGGSYAYVGDGGWDLTDARRHDAGQPAAPSDGGTAPANHDWDPPRDAGGGGLVVGDPGNSSDSGGGWLSHIGSSFASDSGGGGHVGGHGGSDSGGGGDVGGSSCASDSGGGGSSCGSGCGGGGCGGGCGSS